MAAVDSEHKAFLDLSDVVRVLCAVGFTMRWLDASVPSDVTQTGAPGRDQRCGCRVVVTCTKSGLRAVLETSGEECTCSTQQLNVASSNQEDASLNTVISPLSEPATLMLRELASRLTKSHTEDVNTTSTGPNDLSPTNCFSLDVHKQKSELQVRTGLSSRRSLFGYTDELLTSLVPDRDDETVSCPSSPVAGDVMQVGVLQSSSLEALSSRQISGPFCRALCPSPDTGQADDIERRLKLAASCIQEVLTLHRHSKTGTRRDKNSVSTPNLFKVPSVPGSKMKSTTTVSKGESANSVSRNLIKPRPLTPYPGKIRKSPYSDKPPTTRGLATSGRGRATSGSTTSARGRTPSGSVTSGRGPTPSGPSHLRTSTRLD